MPSVNNREPSPSISELTSQATRLVEQLEKFTIFPSKKLNELNELLQKLSLNIQSITGNGTVLDETTSSGLHTLSIRAIAVLKADRFPKLSQISQSLNRVRAETTSTLAGIMAMAGKQDEALLLMSAMEGPNATALSIVKTLSDPVSKALVYASVIKLKDADLVMQQVGTMSDLELDSLVNELNKDTKDPFIRSALIQLPTLVLQENGVEAGMRLAEKISTPSLKIQAYLQLANAGAMHSILEYAVNELSGPEGKKFLEDLRQEFSQIENRGALLDEFIRSIDTGLNTIQEKEKPETKPTEGSSKTIVRKVRKKFSEWTGMSHFFSGNPSNNATKQVTISASEPINIKPRGPTLSPVVQKTNEIVPKDKPLLEQALGGNLFPVMDEMLGKQDISKFTSVAQDDQLTIDLSFTFQESQRLVPPDSTKKLLSALGASEGSIKMLTKAVSMHAHFPKTITACRKTEFGPDEIRQFLEFPDPKQSVRFDIVGTGVIAKTTLKTFNAESLGVNKIEINDRGELIVTFDRINQGAWAHKPLEINLGKGDISKEFWNGIWNPPAT